MNKKLLTNAKNLMNVEALKSVYHSHINSHLSYGLVVWGSMISDQSRDELHKIQEQCMHVVAKVSLKADISTLYKDLKTLPLLPKDQVGASQIGI